MKRSIATIICLLALGSAAIPVGAQTRSRCVDNRTAQDRRYNYRSDSRYDNNVYRSGRNRNSVYRNDGVYRSNDNYRNNDAYRNDDYRYGRNDSVWDRNRDKITTAGGAVGGAVLGGLLGGKKGAIIGAVTGGAGAAIYTYKIRNKDRRY